MNGRALGSLILGFQLIGASGETASGVEDAIRAIRQVGPEGQGNVEASTAWKDLAAADVDQLPRILEAMNGGSDLAANWLRAGAETIIDRALKRNEALPLEALGEFLLDWGHAPRSRSLAFELLSRLDPDLAENLIAGMLNDPSVDLRRLAVQRLIDRADTLLENQESKAASLVYRQALGAARDVDQIESIAEHLEEFGREVNLADHFGFLMSWKVIGPFDNSELKGFEMVYPPENHINLNAEYAGKGGPVRWSDFVTKDELGMVDINKPLGMLKEVTAYAYTEFESEFGRPVELRLGCKNAWKIWLNGEFLFGRDEYHRGAQIDQYRLTGQLKPGKNTILVKLCQNEQEEAWTVEWQFQLRVCDAAGTAIHSLDRLPNS